MNIVEVKELRINYKAREWCKLPYPNHPRGCPNYGKHKECPPQAPKLFLAEVKEKKLFLIYEMFNMAEHEQTMLSRHPWWTTRQARNLLYWQGKVRKRLKQACLEFLGLFENSFIMTCPEARGVNVITTAQLTGLPVTVKAYPTVYKIALAGYDQ